MTLSGSGMRSTAGADLTSECSTVIVRTEKGLAVCHFLRLMLRFVLDDRVDRVRIIGNHTDRTYSHCQYHFFWLLRRSCQFLETFALAPLPLESLASLFIFSLSASRTKHIDTGSGYL